MAESVIVIEDLLRTNDIPSESDRTKIKTIVHQGERDLALLESEIHETTVLLENLRLRQLHLRDQMKVCKRIISPLRRLPAELIREIFHAFRADIVERSVLRKAILSLSQICSRWREIALSMPGLWSSLDIHFRSDDDTSFCQREFIQMWLGRAKPKTPLYFDS